jgi:hypothetical protein
MPGFELLSPEIFRMILQHLDYPKDIIRLDNALSNHKLRPLYLQAIEGMIISDTAEFRQDQTRRSAWIINKKILPLIVTVRGWNNFCALFFLSRSNLMIHTLELSYCDPLPDSIFLTLGLFPSLTTLVLYELKRISCSVSFLRFLSLNSQLRSLTLSAIKTPAVAVISGISQSCPNLTYLNVSENQWFGDECVSLLTKGNLQNLEQIYIFSTSVREHDSIVNLVKTFPHLKELLVPSCELSYETSIFIMNELVLPALRSNDREDQLRGISICSGLLKVQ